MSDPHSQHATRHPEPGTRDFRPAALIYDGTCRFCQAGSARLVRLARPGSVERVDFNAPGVLDRFPHLTRADCQGAMQFITPAGDLYSGPAAIVQALATRPVFRWLPPLYRLPPIRWALGHLYRFVARHRHRLMGRAGPTSCDSGACDTGPKGCRLIVVFGGDGSVANGMEGEFAVRVQRIIMLDREPNYLIGTLHVRDAADDSAEPSPALRRLIELAKALWGDPADSAAGGGARA